MSLNAWSGTRSRWMYVAYAFVILTLLAFIGYLIVYFIYASALFQFPFDYDQGEGFELVDTLMFSRGQWPYQDNNTYPFYSSNYPPVFHLVTVPLVWIFGPQYWTGRLVSFIGTLIAASVIGYAVQREGRRWWLSSLAGLAFLASNYIYHVGPLFRQHMFMVMFEVLAVVLLAVVVEKEELDGKRNNRALLAVMVLLLLAGYTKQLAYATVATVFLFLFLRQTKRAIIWALGFAAVTVAIFFLIDIATGGQWLVNTVTANVNPFIPGQSIGLLRQWFNLHTVILIAAAALAFYQFYFERISVYAIWFAVASVNGLTAGKWGAGESYFATAIAAGCILAGLAFNRVLNHSERQGSRWYAASVIAISMLLLVQANKVFHMPTHSPTLQAIASALGKETATSVPPQTSCSASMPPETVPYVDSAGVGLIGRPPDASDTQAGIMISELIAQGETAAFSEEAGFGLYLGRDIVTNPTQLLNLYNNRQVDLTEMLGMLERQQFDSVVFRAQFYPAPVLEVIGRQYETTDLVKMNGFVYCILRPRETIS